MNSSKNIRDLNLYIISYKQGYISHRIELLLRLKKYFNKVILVTRFGESDNEDNIIVNGYPNVFGLFRIFRLNKLKLMLEQLFYFPSHKILYVRSVIRKLKKHIANDLRFGIKTCIFISVPPHDNLLVGLALKKKFPQITWINDWRDLWSYDEFYLKKTSPLYRKRLLKIEEKVLYTADLNITTNYWAKEVFKKKYNIDSNKIRVINHSYYDKDFSIDKIQHNSNSSSEPNTPIRIGFLGYLFKPPKVPGEEIIAAFRELRKKGLNVELNIYGDTTPAARKFADAAHNPALIFHNRTGHRESLIKISDCDFFLVVLSDLPNCKIIMHSKIPHYFLMGKPIIAIVPEESFVAEIIKKTGAGYIVSVNGNIIDQLVKIFNNHEQGINIPSRNEAEISKFSWPHISRQWLEIFD